MERNKILGVFLLVVLSVCLFSFTVVAGEHPWDEQDNPDGNSSIDTTITSGDGNNALLSSTGSDTNDGFGSLWLTFSYQFTIWYYNDYFNSNQAQLTKMRSVATNVHRGVKYRDR